MRRELYRHTGADLCFEYASSARGAWLRAILTRGRRRCESPGMAGGKDDWASVWVLYSTAFKGMMALLEMCRCEGIPVGTWRLVSRGVRMRLCGVDVGLRPIPLAISCAGAKGGRGRKKFWHSD